MRGFPGQHEHRALLTGGAVAGSGSLASFDAGGSVPAGSGAKATVPFAALGVTSGVLDGVLLQDASGANQPTIDALATPWCIARRASRLGEHKIYAELGLHRKALSALRAQRILLHRARAGRPLTGGVCPRLSVARARGQFAGAARQGVI